jgi:hypothetical protein
MIETEKGGAMRLTKKDALATLVFAAVATPYIGYLIRGEMPFIKDPRGMATVGIVGLALILVIWGAGTTFARYLALIGAGVVGLGVVAASLGVEGSEILLAVFMGGVGLIWLIETIYHASGGPPARASHI